MRCIRELVQQFSDDNGLEIKLDEFDVRGKGQLPGLDYDAYISSGGPGSPLESEGTAWENAWFQWVSNLLAWNADPYHFPKKKVFFICHSYQLACRYFKAGEVCARKSTAFGVFPVHMLQLSQEEKIFKGLRDPFYAVDSRDYQVIRPNHEQLRQMGARILCIEKERPHVPLERAVMAIRFNEHMIGTQFHPEADAIGMSLHLQTPERKETVVSNYGFEKWQSMIDHLEDPDKILFTYNRVLPNFLHSAHHAMQLLELP